MRVAGGVTARLASLLLVLGAVAGCATSIASSATPVATTTVDLPRSYRFDPPAISVPVGSTVTWTNDDQFTHNVTFSGATSLVMKPGDHVTRTFPTAGTFTYRCTLHPADMQGSVIVTGG